MSLVETCNEEHVFAINIPVFDITDTPCVSLAVMPTEENFNKIKTKGKREKEEEKRQTHRPCQNEMQTTLHLNAFLLWTHLIISDNFKKLHFRLILGYFHFHLDVLSTLSAFQTSEGNNLDIFRVLSFTLSQR